MTEQELQLFEKFKQFLMTQPNPNPVEETKVAAQSQSEIMAQSNAAATQSVQEINGLKAQIQALQEQLAAAREQLTAAQEQLSQSRSEVAAKSKEIQSLKIDLARSKEATQYLYKNFVEDDQEILKEGDELYNDNYDYYRQKGLDNYQIHDKIKEAMEERLRTQVEVGLMSEDEYQERMDRARKREEKIKANRERRKGMVEFDKTPISFEGFL